MTAPIQFLHKLCKSTFRRLIPDDSINFIDIKNHLNKITAKDVGFDPTHYKENEMKNNKAPVSYIELHQDENSHIMAVFVVKGGTCLPLHDHPGMSGLLKVIHGKVRITSYTETDFRPLPEHIPVPIQTRATSMKTKTVIKHPDIVVSDTNDCCALTPKEGNIHEIQPLTEFAAFLDILVPPYGNLGCHYYRELQDPAPHLSDYKWLVEIAEPSSYYCDMLPYTGPELFMNDY